MRVLIADDEGTSRVLLESMAGKWGYEPVVVSDGEQAHEALAAADGPMLAVLDWLMPGLDGPEVCRRLRAAPRSRPLFVILLTAKGSKPDVVAGLEAGADDYITKPFDSDELKARLAIGRRVVELQSALSGRVQELEDALAHIKKLQGILPICMHCHMIRTDEASWEKIEEYIEEHSEAQFSHGLCPDCLEKHYPPRGAPPGPRR